MMPLNIWQYMLNVSWYFHISILINHDENRSWSFLWTSKRAFYWESTHCRFKVYSLHWTFAWTAGNLILFQMPPIVLGLWPNFCQSLLPFPFCKLLLAIGNWNAICMRCVKVNLQENRSPVHTSVGSHQPYDRHNATSRFLNALSFV